MALQRFSPITVGLLALALGCTTCAGIRVYEHTNLATFPSAESARLIYLFQIADCVEYREMEAMAKRVRSKTNIPLIGVPLGNANQLGASLEVAGLDLGFEVGLVDREEYEDTMLKLGLSVTPAIVLVDARGIVRFAAPPTKDAAVLASLQRSLEAYVPTLQRSP